MWTIEKAGGRRAGSGRERGGDGRATADRGAGELWARDRPLSHGGHFESQENKKLRFCTSSLALDERLDVQNLLFQHCVIKVYCVRNEKLSSTDTCYR